jgi:hypothetical protein
MNKDFMDNKNINEDVERFKKILNYHSPKQSLKNIYEKRGRIDEYTFITQPQLNEEGEEGDEQAQNQPPMNNMGGGNMGQMPPQPQNMPQDAMNQGGGMNGQMNNEMPPDAQQMPQNGMGGMGAPDMGGMGAEGAPDMGGMDDLGVPQVDNDEDVETEEMEGDEVIDVDELTQSQEATEYKIDGVDDRLAKIYDVVQKFSDKLDKNEESIMALKDEFEKRNPTEEEKLNIRSQTSYPYSETPKGYWAHKTSENPHYNVIYNNDVAPSDEQKEFEIRKSDIDGLNMKSISDTLDMKQDLNKYLGF